MRKIGAGCGGQGGCHDQAKVIRGLAFDGSRLARPFAAGGGAGRSRSAAGEGALRNVVQRGGPAAVRPRDEVSALVLVQRIARNIRGRTEGGPGLRHRLLGHRAEPAQQSLHRHAAGEQPAARARCAREGQGRRCQDAARARLRRRACGFLHRLRQDRPPHPHSGLCEGDGAAGATLSERRRSADVLCPGAQRGGTAGGQDLREPAQGRIDPGSDLPAPAVSPRRRALPDPHLRLSGDRKQRARRGQAVCRDRRSRPARTAHAFAHLHPRRLLEGIDRLQWRVGARGESPQGAARSTARHGLPGLCPSAARPGPAGERRCRRHEPDPGLQPGGSHRTLRACRQSGALHGGTRRLEGRGRAAGAPDALRLCGRHHPFRARARRGAERRCREPQSSTSQSLPSCATNCGPQTTHIGRSRPTSSCRSRTPLSRWRKASATMRSRR